MDKYQGGSRDGMALVAGRNETAESNQVAMHSSSEKGLKCGERPVHQWHTCERLRLSEKEYNVQKDAVAGGGPSHSKTATQRRLMWAES